jgi:light-regulated signal transduction histidine kinase (bacteriophytochrome)
MFTRVRQITYRTVLIYAVAGTLWIILSDGLLSSMTDDPETLTKLQTYKGWFFVTITTILLFFTLRRPLNNLAEESERRRNAEASLREINLKLEEKVGQRTAQYEEANREMEAFTHAVTHELRAPLRGIKSYIEILREESEKDLDDEGKRIVEIIKENACQMQRLIDDLYTLSLVTKNSLKLSQIDMKSMVKALCHEILQASERSDIEFAIHDMPNVFADNNLMKQVWLNLIGNAAKFSGKKEKPIISISGYREGKELIYCVEDNGAGFNPDYYDKLFGVFNRLHSRSDFEGTGVGLSVVRRIVTRHGGRVWAKSELNHGATFWFSLPADSSVLE